MKEQINFDQEFQQHQSWFGAVLFVHVDLYALVFVYGRYYSQNATDASNYWFVF